MPFQHDRNRGEILRRVCSECVMISSNEKNTEQACKGFSRFVLKGNLPGWMTEQLLSILSQIMSRGGESEFALCLCFIFFSLFFGLPPDSARLHEI